MVKSKISRILKVYFIILQYIARRIKGGLAYLQPKQYCLDDYKEYMHTFNWYFIARIKICALKRFLGLCKLYMLGISRMGGGIVSYFREEGVNNRF